MSTADALLHALVDDAAIFPPASTPLRQAVPEHRAHRASADADAVGPLLVRADDAGTTAALLESGERMPVALVVRPGSDPSALPTAVGQLTREDRAEVVGVELPVSDPLTLRPITDLGLPVWLEVRREHLAGDLDAVAAAGCHAKLRTGGLSPDDVPTDDELARFVVGAHERGLRTKLTAGLHHALRTPLRLPGGGEVLQHGVANVLAATAVATNGGDVDEVQAVLAERDAATLRRRLLGLDATQVAAVRRAFASFGCCGVTDPVSELRTLLTVTEEPA